MYRALFTRFNDFALAEQDRRRVLHLAKPQQLGRLMRGTFRRIMWTRFGQIRKRLPFELIVYTGQHKVCKAPRRDLP